MRCEERRGEGRDSRAIGQGGAGRRCAPMQQQSSRSWYLCTSSVFRSCWLTVSCRVVLYWTRP